MENNANQQFSPETKRQAEQVSAALLRSEKKPKPWPLLLAGILSFAAWRDISGVGPFWATAELFVIWYLAFGMYARGLRLYWSKVATRTYAFAAELHQHNFKELEKSVLAYKESVEANSQSVAALNDILQQQRTTSQVKN